MQLSLSSSINCAAALQSGALVGDSTPSVADALAVLTAERAQLLNSTGALPTDGDVIQTATSTVGAYQATQNSAGLRPTWTAVNAAFRNKPTLNFASASSQRLIFDGPAAVLGGDDTAHTIILVLSFASMAANQTLVSFGNGASSSHEFQWLVTNAGHVRLGRIDDANVAATTGSTAIPTALTTATRYVLSLQFTSTQAKVWRDGTAMTPVATTALGAITQTVGAVGALRRNTYLQFLNGSIAWAGFWLGAMADARREEIEDLLLALF